MYLSAVNCLLKVLRGLQIEFTGGQWGFMVNTRVWLDSKDWSQSDGVAVFENSTPHIPASELFALSLMHSLFIKCAFQSADPVRCSRQSLAALQPAMVQGFLHHVNESLAICTNIKYPLLLHSCLSR